MSSISLLGRLTETELIWNWCCRHGIFHFLICPACLYSAPMTDRSVTCLAATPRGFSSASTLLCANCLLEWNVIPTNHTFPYVTSLVSLERRLYSVLLLLVVGFMRCLFCWWVYALVLLVVGLCSSFVDSEFLKCSDLGGGGFLLWVCWW